MKKILHSPKMRRVKAAPRTAFGCGIRKKQETLRKIRRLLRFFRWLTAVLGVAVPLARLILTIGNYWKQKEKTEAQRAAEIPSNP